MNDTHLVIGKMDTNFSSICETQMYRDQQYLIKWWTQQNFIRWYVVWDKLTIPRYMVKSTKFEKFNQRQIVWQRVVTTNKYNIVELI